MPAAPVIAAGVGLYQANKQMKAQSNLQKSLAAEREKDRALLAKQQAAYEARIKKYEKSEFVPLPVDQLKLENVYEGMENIYEEADLSKDVLPAADLAKQQFQLQQANIIQGMRGAAGASGVAGLAQALSGQAAQQARTTSVTIGQQLAANRRLALQEKSRLRMATLQEQSRLAQQERAMKIANIEGKNQFELNKMATLLGVEGARVSGTQQSLAHTMSAQASMQGATMGAVGTALGGMDWGAVGSSLSNLNFGGYGGGTGGMSANIGNYSLGGGTGGIGMPANIGNYSLGGSDRKLKKDISLIGESPSGLNIYSFKYKDELFGKGTYQGVMSDEIPSYAVIQHSDGYDMVDYSKIDVNFKQI